MGSSYKYTLCEPLAAYGSSIGLCAELLTVFFEVQYITVLILAADSFSSHGDSGPNSSGDGRVYGEACVRHVWCDRSQAWRAEKDPV